MSIADRTRNSPRRPARTELSAVSAAEPCPVCRRDHKCSVGSDGLIICGRARGEVAGFTHLGAAQADPQFQLYRRAGGRRSPAPPVVAPGAGTTGVDWGRRARRYEKALTGERLAGLAASLGVGPASVQALGAGYHEGRGCWSCPERDADGTVVGISLRWPDGRKRMIGGGRRGLYFARGLAESDGPIFVVEGFSDAAALLTLGLPVVGRPSNTGGGAELVALLSAIDPARPIVVVGENDARPDGRWPGREGADTTASRLVAGLGRAVSVALPPGRAKDLRDWFRAQQVDPGHAEATGRSGRRLRDALTAAAVEVGPWEPPDDIEDPALPPFPVEALADWQREYAVCLARATQTPVDLPGMGVLGATSASCAKRAMVRVKPGYDEPLNLFATVAQPPASRKSAVVREVAAPIYQRERELLEAARPAIAAAQNAQRIAQRRLDDLQKKAARRGGPEGEQDRLAAAEAARQLDALAVPVVPRLVADDVTPEKAATLLAENRGRLAILSAEGGIFGVMSGRYAGGNWPDKNIDVFLKGHAGDDLRIDRVGRPSDIVAGPALTILLALQPDVIRSLAAEPSFRGRGLLARFLYAMPRSNVGRRAVDPPPVPDAVRDEYRRRLGWLLRMSDFVGAGGRPAEGVIELSPEAYAVHLEFSAWVEPRLGEGGELEPIGDWAGKLVGAVARIAGLLHATDLAGDAPPWSAPIPGPTMARAVRVGRYLIPHARAAFACMGADGALADARHVLAWIRRRGRPAFSRRECFEATKGRFGTVDALEGPLDLLARHGYLRERAPSSRRGPGRPAGPAFDVNPAVLGARAPGTGPAGDVGEYEEVMI